MDNICKGWVLPSYPAPRCLASKPPGQRVGKVGSRRICPGHCRLGPHESISGSHNYLPVLPADMCLLLCRLFQIHTISVLLLVPSALAQVLALLA